MDTRHPHKYTLDLLNLTIQHLPPTFDKKKADAFTKKYEGFMSNASAPYEDIHRAIVELGKESWAKRMAYEEVYAIYGRSAEEAHLHSNLDEGIREKYETFLHEGGKISHIESATSGKDVWEVSSFETYFNAEEKFAIEQALLVARESARDEIGELVLGAKKDAFEKLEKSYGEAEKRIEKQIEDLRNLISVSEKWSASIANRVQTLEEGWSVVEKGLNEERMDKELEYWRGTLESFLNA